MTFADPPTPRRRADGEWGRHFERFRRSLEDAARQRQRAEQLTRALDAARLREVTTVSALQARVAELEARTAELEDPNHHMRATRLIPTAPSTMHSTTALSAAT